LALLVLAGTASARPLEAEDQLALVELSQAYVQAWRADGPQAQREALLPLFSDDAVIIPGGGAEPVQGRAALAEFWFPDGAPPTIVSLFQHDIRYLGGEGDTGLVRGRSLIYFEYDGAVSAQEGNFLLVAGRGADDVWRIDQLMWDSQEIE